MKLGLTRRVVTGSIAVTAALAATATLAVANAGAAPHPSAGHRPVSGGRADVPWSKVGAGWTLATWAPSAHAKRTLFLLDRSGHRWTVKQGMGKDTYLGSWAPGGGRALYTDNARNYEVDLHTGRSRVVPLPRETYPIGYTNPRGRALLASVGNDRLARFGLDARRQQLYPATVRGAGRINTTHGVVETPDGTELVVGADHGLVLLRNNGSVVRRLHAVPAYCTANGWWKPGYALASCGGRMWAVPLDGGRSTQLTSGPNKYNPFGYDLIWRYSRGRLGLATNGCGPATLVRFGPRGNGTRIHIPSPTEHPGYDVLVGHAGDTVDLLHQSTACGPQTNMLFGWNAVTGHRLVKLGAPATSGTVISAQEYRA